MAQHKTLIIIGVVLVVLAAGGAFYFMQSQKTGLPAETEEPSTFVPPAEPEQAAPEESAPKSVVAVIETNKGSFEVTLDGKAAPKTVANFIKLAEQGFYKNLTFHRIVQDFVIQGGDPQGDGTGGPGYTVPAEIGLKHTKGAIAMARTGDAVNPTKASSGSQFYIALQDLPMLDGEYTVFGYVSSGMDVVEAIGRAPTEPNPVTGEASVPIEDVFIRSVSIKE